MRFLCVTCESFCLSNSSDCNPMNYSVCGMIEQATKHFQYHKDPNDRQNFPDSEATRDRYGY